MKKLTTALREFKGAAYIEVANEPDDHLRIIRVYSDEKHAIRSALFPIFKQLGIVFFTRGEVEIAIFDGTGDNSVTVKLTKRTTVHYVIEKIRRVLNLQDIPSPIKDEVWFEDYLEVNNPPSDEAVEKLLEDAE